MELLEELTQTPAIAGREHRLRALIRGRADSLVDEWRMDALGSLIGIRKPTRSAASAGDRPLRVMVACHMDQIGFLVRHIDDKGFLRIQAVGGFDTRNLFARLAKVCTSAGDLPGVVNPTGKPVHVASEEEKKKVPELHELAVDLGLPADEVKEKVAIGDMVVLQAPFTEVGNTYVAQALDNRIACYLGIRALESLAEAGHACELACAFTVQEEVGLRGAGTAAFGVAPDVGIAVDTTLCVDTPGVPEDQHITHQGAGATLKVMDASAIADPALLEQFESLANERGIAYQRSILPRGGTDAGTMQRAGAGCPTLTMACPTRYIHTVTEMVHRDDLEACRQLLNAYLTTAESAPRMAG